METSSLKPYDLTQEIFLFSSKTNCTHLGRLVFDQAQKGFFFSFFDLREIYAVIKPQKFLSLLFNKSNHQMVKPYKNFAISYV